MGGTNEPSGDGDRRGDGDERDARERRGTACDALEPFNPHNTPRRAARVSSVDADGFCSGTDSGAREGSGVREGGGDESSSGAREGRLGLRAGSVADFDVIDVGDGCSKSADRTRLR